ncbi:MAG: hypothetical protein Q8934_19785 [Bacillota bacterium]|nr:hypothetical protein [Bacillota bacterium]
MNTKAMLMANTNVDEENFYEKQNEMENPLVLVMNADTLEVIEHFKIVALDMEDLKKMFELKLFFTSSIPAGTTQRKYGALFHGVEPNHYENYYEEDEESEEPKLAIQKKLYA